MRNSLIKIGESFFKEVFDEAAKSVGAIEYAGVWPAGGVYSGPSVLSTNYRGNISGGQDWWFFGNDGFNYQFVYNSNLSAGDAYERCAPLTSIINRKAQAYINGRTRIVNSKGKESMDPDAKRIRNLLQKPNPLQPWKQFEAQQKIYIETYGFCICLPIIPFGFEDEGPIRATALWNIPPFMVDIKETNKLWYQTDMNGILKSIVLKYKDQKIILDTTNIFIFRDITPSTSSMIFPESRICALEGVINNIISAYESRNVLINRRGALGILSNAGKDPMGTVPMDPEEKRHVQNEFNKYGLKGNQWQIIVTNAALQWQQMGYPTKDLMLFEEIEDDIQRICDGYGFPYRMMAGDKVNSLGGSDVDSYNKILYQDTIIPEADSAYEQWNLFFRTFNTSITIEKDFSHIACLQENRMNAGRARWYFNQALLIEYQNNLITRNQWLEENGMEPIGPDGDLYLYELQQQGIINAPAPAVNSDVTNAGEQINEDNFEQGNTQQ